VTDHDDARVDETADTKVVLAPPADPLGDARRELAEQRVEQARDGVNLVGPGGLLADLTKRVLETGLEVEMSEHLGYDKYALKGRDGGNSRKRYAREDGTDRDRPGRDRRPP
jgi:transposase-like protein